MAETRHVRVTTEHKKEWERIVLRARSEAESIQLLADALRDRAVKEAEWCRDNLVGTDDPETRAITEQHIAALKRGEV